MPNDRLRVIIHGAASPSFNMAVDEALLLHIKEPALRIYQWDCPAISIGYFQPACLVPEGRCFVRRYTGGGLVDHAYDLTYTIVLPREHPVTQVGTAFSYCTIHRAISAALQEVGIPNTVTTVTMEGESVACFAKPVAYDIIHIPTGRKIAGAAQRRNRYGVLHQGSIQHPVEGTCLPPQFREKMISYIAKALHAEPVEDQLTVQELADAHRLDSTRYSTWKWNHYK